MKTQCSVITVPEIGGLIKNLMDYLGGKRAQFWLKAFKRFLRKENPWIPFQKVLGLDSTSTDTNTWIGGDLQKVRAEGIDIFDELANLKGRPHKDYPGMLIYEIPIDIGCPIPQHSVVAVRIGDLLSREELLSFTYQQILNKAKEEHALDWCSLRAGLNAWEVILEGSKNKDSSDRNIHCFICTEPFCFLEDAQTVHRIPMLCASDGRTGKTGKENERGYACMYLIDGDVNTPPPYTKNSLRNPDAILLFRSIPY